MSTSSTSNASSARSAASSSRARAQRWQSRATSSRTVLRIQPSDRARLGHPAHGDAVRRDPQRYAPCLVQLPRLAERAADDLAQPLVHLGLRPEELLEALHPLEVGD